MERLRRTLSKLIHHDSSDRVRAPSVINGTRWFPYASRADDCELPKAMAQYEASMLFLVRKSQDRPWPALLLPGRFKIACSPQDLMGKCVELANISDYHATLANQVHISPMAYQHFNTLGEQITRLYTPPCNAAASWPIKSPRVVLPPFLDGNSCPTFVNHCLLHPIREDPQPTALQRRATSKSADHPTMPSTAGDPTWSESGFSLGKHARDGECREHMPSFLRPGLVLWLHSQSTAFS
jgi:hypothetical protein